MTTNPTILANYINHDLNILLEGKHGVGKTQMLQQACAKLGVNLKYYSASTLDPYTDLVGIPVPETREDGTQILKSVRPRAIDEAEVIFFDELNRADPKVTNAVFELIQFRSINGERLPKLRCVIAAQNPSDDDYNVDALDPALADRFDIKLSIEADPSVSYLSTVLKQETAKALVRWWKEHTDKANYVSPRRLEILGKLWEKFGTQQALQDGLPPGDHNYDVGKLAYLLKKNAGDDPNAEPAKASAFEVQKKITDNDVFGVRKFLKTDKDAVLKSWRHLSPEAINQVLEAISFGHAGPDLVVEYADLLRVLTRDQAEQMTKGWVVQKYEAVEKEWKHKNTPFGKFVAEKAKGA